ncbi:AAA family ATPase [Sphingomonas daechungensis]|uniref:AAA family ATPase n=1 Tax=Sphingomonas daechungensis TaxID=1176646 RepID=UPI0037837909
MNVARFPIDLLKQAYAPLEADADRPHVELGDYELLTADDLGLPKVSSVRAMIERPQGDDRSKDAYWCALDMLGAGFSDEQVVGVLMNPSNAVSGHMLDAERPLRAATRALEAAHRTMAKNGQERADGHGAGSSAAEYDAGGKRPFLPVLDPADLEGVEVPPRDYVVQGLILAGALTMLTGPGAAGKSLLMLQTAMAVALGARLLGMKTTQLKVAYWSAEDDDREHHARLVDICASYGVKLSDLRDKMLVGSLIALEDKALATVGRNDRLTPTALFEALRQTIIEHDLKFVVLDNAGHLYGGDENVRQHVVPFLGLLNKLALETGCAIVLISHPNKSGSSYSGVTAWQNQVRAQLHLERPNGEHDSNVRELRLEKANYAPPGEPIRMLWHHGAFIREEDVPADDPTRTTALQLRLNEIFYACLRAATARQQSASAGRSSPYYAPKLFAEMTEAHGVSVGEFERTMNRLLSAGMIEVGALPFNRPSSRNKAEGLRIVDRRSEGDDDRPM